MSVQYKGEGYDAETLVWNSNGTWSNTETGWYKQGDGTKTDTSFLNGDAVIFTAAEGSKTVNFVLLPPAEDRTAGTPYY